LSRLFRPKTSWTKILRLDAGRIDGTSKPTLVEALEKQLGLFLAHPGREACGFRIAARRLKLLHEHRA
jgi:hypothetical protein